ncbi:MAG: DUF533 domain-containing protein [Pseudomonadota bacterium]
MYDYKMVFVYPLSMPVEDLSELGADALDELERSISSTIDEGWEYVSMTTYSKNKPAPEDHAKRGLKAFVYRRFRHSNATFSGPSAAAVMRPIQNTQVKHEEDPALTAPQQPERGRPPKEEKKTTLLTMALLNALRSHSDIKPETILPKLLRQQEISERQAKVLTRTLRRKLSAGEIAEMTPPGFEKEVFQVSLMPFGDQDAEYTDYLAELAVYLELDEAFISEEVAAKRL